MWPQASASPLWLCFLIWKVEIPPLTRKSTGKQWVKESKVPTTVCPSSLFLCAHIFSIYTDVCGDAMGTLYSSRHWRQRISKSTSNQCQVCYYSSVRKSFLVFRPSRDIARQPRPPTDWCHRPYWVSNKGGLPGWQEQPQLQPPQAENCKFPGSQPGRMAFQWPLPGRPQMVLWELSNVRHQETCRFYSRGVIFLFRLATHMETCL